MKTIFYLCGLLLGILKKIRIEFRFLQNSGFTKAERA